MDIAPFLTKACAELEQTLKDLIPSIEGSLYSALFESAKYSLLAPAKRLRPLLVLAVVESYTASHHQALYPACALEMIHTYSLIHDDLPCMDDDDLRRGKPALHKAYPEWQALLTGDYLLTLAFEVLALAPNLDSEQKITLVRSLSRHAGAHGMIGGQLIDLQNEGRMLDWPTLEQMHEGKTASLIIAALEFGGIIAKAPQKDIATLKIAGSKLGIAFQLIDDVLDAIGQQEELGKPVGSDKEKKKATAVPLLGIEGVKAKANDLLAFAEEKLMQLSRPVPLLHSLFDQMVDRRK
jgi:geranylgeranyl diphosphate synthase type II